MNEKDIATILATLEIKELKKKLEEKNDAGV